MKITRFSGINNVQPPERLLPDKRSATTALSEALNVDIGLNFEIQRRKGLTVLQDAACLWVWEAAGFTLAVVAGDLVSVDGDTVTTLHASVGTDRMWYANWPDGRTAYTNGTVAGLATVDAVTGWGSPNPAIDAVVVASNDTGTLPAGDYQWAISYVRDTDGFEGGLTPGDDPVTLAEGHGLDFSSLPALAGFSINVHLTHANGEVFRLAGNTTGATFSFSGAVKDLIRSTMTEDYEAAPAGRLCAFWRGCSLVAVGPLLFISEYLQPEHFDIEQGFRPFTGDITLVQPVDGGVFVGTGDELVYMRGSNTNELNFESGILGASVVLGSGVTVPGEYLKRGDGTAGKGDCMLAIVNGNVMAGYQDGSLAALTQGVYATDATEVSATFRYCGAIPQYIAVPL
jgi:hypothetical protein